MKALLVTPFYKNGVVGPAKFAVIVKAALPDFIDILTENSNDPDVYSIDINLNFFERKLTQYFNRFYYHNKIYEILKHHPEYTHVIFINGILGFRFRPPADGKIKVVHMINHEQYAVLKFYLNLRYFAELFYVWMEKQTIKYADHLIVNSTYLKNKLLRDFKLKTPDKIQILHKAIDVKKYPFKKNLSINPNDVKLLFIKFDWNRGGLVDIALAIKRLPELKFIVTIVGPNISVNQKIARFFNKISNVRLNFVGKRSEEEVIDIMSKNDILCIPSRSEALGVAIMEGLAVGIPVVTTSAGGIGEVTNEGEYAWVAKIQNPDSLAKVLNTCIYSENERKVKSLGGRKFVERNFDLNILIQNLMDCLCNK